MERDRELNPQDFREYPAISSLANPNMPSGPKKRKTAKKKKEEANANSEGNDEVRSQDEKGSDSCDSLSSYNHHNHDRSVDMEDDESENIAPWASHHPAVAESQSMEKNGTPESEPEDYGVLKVEMAIESPEDSEAKHVSLKHVEFAKRSVDPSSSSNSSDDDSRVSETKSEDENLFLKTNSDNENSDSSSPKKLIGAPEDGQPKDSFDLIVQTSSVLHSIPAEVSASEEAVAMAENASTQNSVIAYVITSDIKDSQKTPLPMLVESTMDSTSENHEEKSSPSNGTEIPKSFENQPLVASAPRAMQKTSFLSCCGLFDVVSSSDR